MKITANLSLLLVLFTLSICGARGAEVVPFHTRDGLPNFRTKAEAGGEVRVAYLGGSITAEEGWRVLSFDFLKKQFPRATFTQIFAAAPGTGSDLGACRVGNDALSHAPDLLFVEFGVNDETTPDERVLWTMEGIVRQAWRANPKMDICFVYTLSFRGLPDLTEGRYTKTVNVMERLATYYGIPSVFMGADVAKRIENGTLVFGKKGGVPESELKKGQSVFTRDSVHPTPAGQAMYMEILAKGLPAIWKTGFAGRAHVIGAPLSKNDSWQNWEYATILPIASLKRIGDWKKLPADDPHVVQQAGRLAPTTWAATEKGAALEFTIHGPVFGLVAMCSPDSGQFSVTIDDREPVIFSFFDRFVSKDFIRMSSWFYPQPLDEGPHRVRIELTGAALDKAKIKGEPLEDEAAYKGLGLYIGGVLTISKLDSEGK